MKLLVFSDIHGNIYTLEKFLEDSKKLEYDKMVFLGDIFGYYYHQKEIVSRLKKISDLIWLKGNHDAYAIEIFYGRYAEKEYTSRFGSTYHDLPSRLLEEDIKYIAGLPSSITLNDSNGAIGIFHGTPDDPIEGRQYPNDEILCPKLYAEYHTVILGHTHWRMLRFVNETMIINPGSLGQPRDGKDFGFAIIDTICRTVEFKDVVIDKSLLYQEIEKNDPSMEKLKDVLERKNGS